MANLGMNKDPQSDLGASKDPKLIALMVRYALGDPNVFLIRPEEIQRWNEPQTPFVPSLPLLAG
jgi:hypothetical protein